MIGVLASGVLHAGAAALLLALLSLIGFAALPAGFRTRRAVLAAPASLAVGLLLVGWTSWMAGTFLGTSSILPLFAALVLLSLIRANRWRLSVARCGARLMLLAKANPVGACGVALVIAMMLPQLLLPLADSDGIAYHVALPKLFLLTGHVWFVPWTFVSAFPQAVNMIYLIALRIAGGETAKFIHAGFFVASLATLALTVHRGRHTRAAAMIAPFLYAAAPVVLAPAGAAFVDHAAAFSIGAAALILFRRGSPSIAGCAMGAALAAKITVAPAIAGLMVYAVGTSPRARWPRLIAALALPVAIAFAPFAIRNWQHTGDPIYPIGYALLRRNVPGIAADRVAYTAYFHSGVPGPLGIGWTSDPEHVQGDEVAGIHHALGLFAIALAIRIRWTRRWLALILPYLAVALVFRPPTRYLLPMFYGLSALEAYALVLLARRAATWIALVAALPALMSCASFTLTWLAPGDYLLGRIDRQTFLATRIPGYRAAEFVNRLPSGGQVMALDFPGPYYFDRPWIAEGILNDPPLRQWLTEAQSTDALLARLRDVNVRYLVVTPGYGGGTPASLLPLARNRREAALIADLRRHLVLLRSVDHVDVLAVPAK